MASEHVFGIGFLGVVVLVAIVGFVGILETQFTGLATLDSLAEAQEHLSRAQEEFRLTASFLSPAKIHAIVSPLIKAEYALKQAKKAFATQDTSKLAALETAHQSVTIAKDRLTVAGTVSQGRRPPLVKEAKEQLNRAQEILEKLT